MEFRADLDDRPQVSTEERESSELIKRLRKLRWIGMEKRQSEYGQIRPTPNHRRVASLF
jgi:hypothetical protein